MMLLKYTTHLTGQRELARVAISISPSWCRAADAPPLWYPVCNSVQLWRPGIPNWMRQSAVSSVFIVFLCHFGLVCPFQWVANTKRSYLLSRRVFPKPAMLWGKWNANNSVSTHTQSPWLRLMRTVGSLNAAEVALRTLRISRTA